MSSVSIQITFHNGCCVEHGMASNNSMIIDWNRIETFKLKKKMGKMDAAEYWLIFLQIRIYKYLKKSLTLP